MSEMIERVARAIGNCPDNDERWLTMKPNLEKMARAAIEAMREPTQEMIEAPYGLRASADDFIHKAFYQSMIAAALEDSDLVVAGAGGIK